MGPRRFVLASVLVLFVSLTAGAQTYIFGRADFSVGNSPNALVAGDFNGDGVPDVAVTNSYDNTISVLLGQATGGFAAQVTYPTGPLPVAIVAGDFNGDGNLDLAVTNGNCTLPSERQPPQCSPSTVSIFLGNGNGTFQPQVTYSVGTLPVGIVTSDFNGDGKLDLAVLNDGTISILLGNGDGTFQAQVTYPAAGSEDGLEFQSPSLLLGDFNGDGKVDLVSSGSDVFAVLLSNGDGTFRPAPASNCSSCGGGAVGVGDFNGDGELDLVVTGGLTTNILLGHGDGTFYLNATYTNGVGTGVAVADLNGDGKPDLVITQPAGYLTNYSGSFAVQLGNGDGTFGNPVFYGSGLLPYGAILADFNGDGKFDVAIADSGCGPLCGIPPSFHGYVSVVFGFGDGTFVGTTDYTAGLPNLENGSMLAADFANNGDLDLAIAESRQPAVGILTGNGNGTFQPVTSFSTAQYTNAIIAGDLRNDGNLDLVSANDPCGDQITNCAPGSVSVLLGNGDGTFQTHVDYPAGLQPSGIALGSFRNNGTLDIAVTNNGADTVSILVGNGDGTFKPQVVYATGAYPEQIVIGDFNKDGNLDLAIATLNNASILLGNGDGTFKSQVSYSPGGTSIIAGDFNGDGNLDLALASADAPVPILLGNGDGTFQSAIITSIFGQSLAAKDFNGDGKLDLAVVGGQAALLALGNGDGTFQRPVGYPVAVSVGGLTVGDFNGDGVPDWAAVDDDSNVIAVMLSAPFKSISPGSLNFGSHGTGTTSLPQTITFSNPSNVQFNIASIVASGNFAQTNNCGASLAVGADCTITATFSPTATGQQSGAITITDSTRISPVAIPLNGNGVSGSFLMLYPARQNFSPQGVGTTSGPAAIQLVNTGNSSLTISGVSISGTNSPEFSQTNNCGASLAAGASCTANATFTPQGLGSRVAALSISDGATGSPQTATLSGTGLGAAAGINPISLAFTAQTAGTISNAQIITLTNSGTAPLNISGITASQNFDETNTCSTSVAAGSNCQISVTFSPSTSGNLTGTITISDNATGSPQTISLSGVATGASFSLGPASGSPTSQTINAGQGANFTLSIASSGSFNGTVNLSCNITQAGSPAPTCALSNSSVQITNGASQTVSVTVATTAPTTSALIPYGDHPERWASVFWAGILLFPGCCLLGSRRRRGLGGLAAMLLLIVGLGCGGSSSPSATGHTTPGTPAGSYTATVTATSGNLTSNTTLTVTVK